MAMRAATAHTLRSLSSLGSLGPQRSLTTATGIRVDGLGEGEKNAAGASALYVCTTYVCL